MILRKAGYWVTTGLLALAFGFGGVVDLSLSPEVVSGLAHLGYPAYLGTILGVWKVLAVPALLAPRLAILKEWAYAGIAFDLIGAAASHAYSGDKMQDVVTPLILLAITAVSWATRPAGRTLVKLPGLS